MTFGSLVTPSTSSATSLPNRLADFVDRDIAVLDHVVQQAGDDRRLVHLQVGQQAGDGDRVREVRVARMAQLLAVLHDGEDVGLVEFVVGRVRLVGLYAIDEFVLTQEFAARGFAAAAGAVGVRLS